MSFYATSAAFYEIARTIRVFINLCVSYFTAELLSSCQFLLLSNKCVLSRRSTPLYQITISIYLGEPEDVKMFIHLLSLISGHNKVFMMLIYCSILLCREHELDAKFIISMEKNQTKITNLKVSIFGHFGNIFLLVYHSDSSVNKM